MKVAKIFLIVIIATALLEMTNASADLNNSLPLIIGHQIIHPPDWQFETNQAAQTYPDNRALVVSSGCDVNGDGYDDLLVGDKEYDVLYNQQTIRDAGEAWLFLGSAAGLSITPSMTFTSPSFQVDGLFGWNVACAGDVNSDGYEDIMIGMVNYYPNDALCPNCYDEGAEYVYYGSPTGPKSTPDWMARGNSPWGFMGTYADSAGDVNGDGYDDVIIGTAENSQQSISHAYVWYGGKDGLKGDLNNPGLGGTNTNADWIATDPAPRGVSGNWFGFFVYGIGDVNGDTFDDVMVTACCSFISDQHQYPGAVYVYYGSSTGLSNSPDWTAAGDKGGSRFGVGGDGIGDLNGDGYDDLAVGADCDACLQPDGGHAFVWYGSNSGLGPTGTPGNADWNARGVSDSLLGIVVRPAGDVDHDGFADLIVTAMGYDVPTSGGTLYDAGAWLIWKGSAEGLGENGTTTNADIMAVGDQAGAGLGLFEAGAADVNGDQWDDIFVTAYLYSDPEVNEGAVFGYYSPIEVWQNLFVPLILKSQ
jgi:hypothetical protein